MLVWGVRGRGPVTFRGVDGLYAHRSGDQVCANAVCIDACRSRLDCNCEPNQRAQIPLQLRGEHKLVTFLEFRPKYFLEGTSTILLTYTKLSAVTDTHIH